MKTYDAYKDSKVKWIGEIPKSWKLSKVKFIAKVYGGSTPNSSTEDFWNGNINWITTDDLGKLTSSVILKSRRTITNEGLKDCGASLLPVDSLIVSCRAPIGHLGILGIEACTNQGCKGLVFNFNSNYKYFFYSFEIAKEALNVLGKGTTFLELSGQLLKDFPIVLPAVLDQITIVNYLDNKTAQIDKIISKKEKLLLLLEEERKAIINQAVTKGLSSDVKLKDSGVEWLGGIPEHWNIKKLKFVLKVKLQYGANEQADEENRLDPRYIRITDFGNDGNLRNNTFKSLSLHKSKDYMLQEGDILFARSGATVGKTFQFKNYEGKACFAGYLIKASPNEDIILSDFLYTYTKSSFYENWKNNIFIQATIQNIGADKYSTLLVPFPSIDEQKDILEYLRKAQTKTNKVIYKIQKEIELLNEYKQSIIFEAVTGKIDVRETKNV